MVISVPPPNCVAPASTFQPDADLKVKAELYQAIIKLKQIADAISPALTARGIGYVVEEIKGHLVQADETEIVILLQKLYEIVAANLFPIHFPDFMCLDDTELHLDCIPIEPIWLDPVDGQTGLYGSAPAEIDAQLHDIFVEGYGPIEETYPELGLVALNGQRVAQGLIKQHHGNSWKHCFGWYLLALIHETGSWFYDELITDEWIYEEIWADTVWTADLVSQFADAFDEAKGIEKKIERFHRWVDKKPRERYRLIIAFIQDFQREKIQTYWKENNEQFFRTTFPDDAIGFSPDPHAAHPMGWWENHHLSGGDS